MKSIYAWYIVYLTGPFKPAKNQTNMKKWISLPHCHTINSFYNIASKFVWSNSIAWVCFIFLLCTLMTSANKSLREFCIQSENKVHLHAWIHLSVFFTNLRHDRLERNKMFSWNKIINVLKHSRGNLNPFTTFKPCVCGLWKKFTHAYLFQTAGEKLWLHINNIHEKIRESLW